MQEELSNENELDVFDYENDEDFLKDFFEDEE